MIYLIIYLIGFLITFIYFLIKACEFGEITLFDMVGILLTAMSWPVMIIVSHLIFMPLCFLIEKIDSISIYKKKK